MKENYKTIGSLVDLLDERNADGKIENLIGVSIDKCFIKSVANTIGTDLTKYQVIRKNDFACSLMQVSRDGKIPIACLKDYDEAIMSPAYHLFRIKDTSEVLPEYMAMWFARPEFDREAAYIAVGGVRGSMTWEDFCKMRLPVPAITEQQKLVNAYNTIENRIQIKKKINEKLEETISLYFDDLFPSILHDGKNTIGEVIDFSNGKARPSEAGEIPVYGGNGIMAFTNKTNANNCIAIGRVGAYCGSTYLCKNECWISDNAIQAKAKNTVSQLFIFYLLKKYKLFDHHIGTGQQLLTQGILSALTFNKPELVDIEKFIKSITPVYSQIELNEKELQQLAQLKQLLITQLSSE